MAGVGAYAWAGELSRRWPRAGVKSTLDVGSRAGGAFYSTRLRSETGWRGYVTLPSHETMSDLESPRETLFWEFISRFSILVGYGRDGRFWVILVKMVDFGDFWWFWSKYPILVILADFGDFWPKWPFLVIFEVFGFKIEVFGFKIEVFGLRFFGLI